MKTDNVMFGILIGILIVLAASTVFSVGYERGREWCVQSDWHIEQCQLKYPSQSPQSPSTKDNK